MKRFKLRDLTETEIRTLRQELKSSNKTVVWRSQAVLMHSEEHLTPQQIADRVGYSREIVRQVLNAFVQEGIAAIYPQSRARKDDQRAYQDTAREQLKEMVHQSPRDYGVESSTWTLVSLATVSYERGLTAWLVNPDTVSDTLHEIGMDWKKAKRYIQSPDETYDVKKNDATGSRKQVRRGQIGSS